MTLPSPQRAIGSRSTSGRLNTSVDAAITPRTCGWNSAKASLSEPTSPVADHDSMKPGSGWLVTK